MSKSRLILLALLVAGIVIETSTIYFSYHPLSPFGNPAIVLDIIFLVVAPVVVWRMQGERLLRALVILTWVAYLTMWCIGIYRMYLD